MEESKMFQTTKKVLMFELNQVIEPVLSVVKTPTSSCWKWLPKGLAYAISGYPHKNFNTLRCMTYIDTVHNDTLSETWQNTSFQMLKKHVMTKPQPGRNFECPSWHTVASLQVAHDRNDPTFPDLESFGSWCTVVHAHAMKVGTPTIPWTAGRSATRRLRFPRSPTFSYPPEILKGWDFPVHAWPSEANSLPLHSIPLWVSPEHEISTNAAYFM